MSATATEHVYPIDCRSRLQPRGEYLPAYDQERGGWLRRRLLWYAGTSLVLGLALSLMTMFVRSEAEGKAGVTTLLISNAAASCRIYPRVAYASDRENDPSDRVPLLRPYVGLGDRVRALYAHPARPRSAR